MNWRWNITKAHFFQQSPSGAEKAIFQTPMGNLHYTVMSFGLKNTGVTYKCATTSIFQNMFPDCLADYGYDIFVKS